MKIKYIIPILLILIVMTTTILKIKSNKIENYYSKYIETTGTTKIYNEKYKEIGTLEKGVRLKISKIENNMFKIEDSIYLIDYKNTKKINKISETSKKYLPLNYSITKENIKNKYFNLRNIDLEVIKEDNKFYKVKFLNNIYDIEKEGFKRKEKQQKEEYKNKISILNYSNVTDINHIESHLKYLKEKGYLSVTEEDINDMVNGKINLEKKTIFIVLKKETNEIRKLFKKYNYNYKISNKYILTNSSSNKKRIYSSYDMKNINLANFDKLLNNEIIFEGEKATSIPVINYHFFYDPTLDEKCGELICLTTQKFESHLKYLKDNGYRTLTMREYVDWIYGRIELPKKSVLLTIDDGAMGTGKHNGNKLNPLLEKYQINATLFLITGWWNIENYRGYFLDIESHTNDMHLRVKCDNLNRKKPQIYCKNNKEILDDLKKSIEITNSNDAFCFPFYAQDERTRNLVKEAGFKVAFIGGNRRSTRNDNKMLEPRYPIKANITLEEFIRIVTM